MKIVERRVVLRDVADESEVRALVAGGFEYGEVGVVGKKFVSKVGECVRGRKARVLRVELHDRIIGGAGFEHQARSGSAARIDVDGRGDFLGPAMLIHEHARADQPSFFAIVDQENYGMARPWPSLQRSRTFQHGRDAHAIVGCARAGGHGIIVRCD